MDFQIDILRYRGKSYLNDEELIGYSKIMPIYLEIFSNVQQVYDQGGTELFVLEFMLKCENFNRGIHLMEGKKINLPLTGAEIENCS